MEDIALMAGVAAVVLALTGLLLTHRERARKNTGQPKAQEPGKKP